MRKVRLYFKGLWNRFVDSSFVTHISFLWHWKNFFFLLRYPFYKVYDRWNGKFLGYSYIEYDSIPEGWRKAFGKHLSDDIKKAGKESRRRLGYKSWKEMIIWTQIKEKWGELRMYASCTEEIRHVLDRYEYMSYGYCINCGRPARYKTRGWISFQCEECFQKDLSRYVDDNERYRVLNECKLTKDDIPQGVRYSVNKQGKILKHKINYKRIYGIDLKELWGIK